MFTSRGEGEDTMETDFSRNLVSHLYPAISQELNPILCNQSFKAAETKQDSCKDLHIRPARFVEFI